MYVDTSFLAPLFKVEQRSSAVRHFFERETSRKPTISHWTRVERVEFSSLVAKDIRIGLYPSTEAASIATVHVPLFGCGGVIHQANFAGVSAAVEGLVRDGSQGTA